MSLAKDNDSLFGFRSGDWFERVRAAESSGELGTLGPYRLISEVGRGGQGVVFRALQPGTGRTIALKRLLAGSFAAPVALRRFQREAEAAASLQHPGIVTIHGVEFVDGSPLLAMEWIDGVPVTDWARGKPRADVLRVFLQICEAVQHAHQHGVLHRDLKPANVLVDASGRPRLLDFGLAKVPDAEGTSLTQSGGFLGTPAYAAPEQWRGEAPDARADIYSLGAILFELLTGRRALEGEAHEILARGEALSPPRPSSHDRGLPRDLDAIVAQAMASEPARRYQSVDGLAADLRRFLEGRPVLAHGPSAWYLTRKLVVRSPIATGALFLFLAASFSFSVINLRQARRLKEERDRSRDAAVREKAAREEAQEERARAEEQRLVAVGQQKEAEARRQEAQLALVQAREAEADSIAVLRFVVEDVIAKTAPQDFGRPPTMTEVLSSASQRVAGLFSARPKVEMNVRHNLGGAFLSLGAYVEAETELRLALQVKEGFEGVSPLNVAVTRVDLGDALAKLGRFDEALAELRAALELLDALDPENEQVQPQLYTCLFNLQSLAIKTRQIAQGLEWNARLTELVTDEKVKILCRSNRAALLATGGRIQEAVEEYEALLPEMERLLDPRDINLGVAYTSICAAYCQVGRLEESVAHGRKAVELLESVYGEEHPQVATALARLAEALIDSRKLDEAMPVAERGIAMMRKSASKGLLLPDLLHCRASIQWQTAHKTGESKVFHDAANDFIEAAELFEASYGRGINKWSGAIRDACDCLASAGLHVDAVELLEQSAPEVERRYWGWALFLRAVERQEADDFEAAAPLFDAAILALEGDKSERGVLFKALQAFSALLKSSGDDAGAEELEERARLLKANR